MLRLEHQQKYLRDGGKGRGQGEIKKVIDSAGWICSDALQSSHTYEYSVLMTNIIQAIVLQLPIKRLICSHRESFYVFRLHVDLLLT